MYSQKKKKKKGGEELEYEYDVEDIMDVFHEDGYEFTDSRCFPYPITGYNTSCGRTLRI